MFTAPTAIRAKEDPNGEFIKQYDLSVLKKPILAGERCDNAAIRMVSKHSHSVIDHWWQTATGQ
jgi:propionyl-CoA synthetase